jgi:hypothetical protein
MISYVSILGTPYVSYSNITEKYENIQLGKEKNKSSEQEYPCGFHHSWVCLKLCGKKKTKFIG